MHQLGRSHVAWQPLHNCKAALAFCKTRLVPRFSRSFGSDAPTDTSGQQIAARRRGPSACRLRHAAAEATRASGSESR